MAVFLFVATLGYSRRIHVRAFLGERQEDWFEGMASAYTPFGGVPQEVLLDNARALISRHDPERNVSTILRQLVLEFRLVLAPFSWAG